MNEFETVARVGEIPDHQGRCYAVDGTMVAVFREGDEYFALNDFCPHMGASLSEGHVQDGTVMCPWHAWRFRLCDGTWMDNSRSGIQTATYDVRIQEGQIQVCVPPPAGESDSDNPPSEAASNAT